jgi:hypothetical protein
MDFAERSLAVLHFPEPLLEFGSAQNTAHPKDGLFLRLHTRHTRWRMCTTGAVTASGQTVACSGQGQWDPAGPALNPRRLASPPERESARRTGKGINRGNGKKRQFGCLING